MERKTLFFFPPSSTRIVRVFFSIETEWDFSPFVLLLVRSIVLVDFLGISRRNRITNGWLIKGTFPSQSCI